MSTADNPSTPPRPQRVISSVIIQNTPPQRVWEAITQPEFTSQYFFGSRVEIIEDEPGRLRYLSPDGREVWGDGAILESDPPRLLVVEWRSLYLPDAAHEPASRVTWQLEPWTDGATNSRSPTTVWKTLRLRRRMWAHLGLVVCAGGP